MVGGAPGATPRRSAKMQVTMTTDWNPVAHGEFAKPYWPELHVRPPTPAPHRYPPHDEVFAALHLTPYTTTRVLILGQDLQHGARQAHGLCFGRPGGHPSVVVNIHKELHDDVGLPGHGNLEAGPPRCVVAQHDAHRAPGRRRRTRGAGGRRSPTR